jgi:hypothetical protein
MEHCLQHELNPNLRNIPTRIIKLSVTETITTKNVNHPFYLFMCNASDCFHVKQLACVIMNATYHNKSNGMALIMNKINDVFCSKIGFILIDENLHSHMSQINENNSLRYPNYVSPLDYHFCFFWVKTS